MPKIHWDRFLWINCVQLFVGTHGPYPTRLLCPWNFPGKNTRVVCLALLPTQGIFPTQGSNPHLQCLLYWIWILYLLSHWGSPIICVCVCVCVCVCIWRKWQPAPIFLPGKSCEQRSLVGCSQWGPKRIRLDSGSKTKQLHVYMHIIMNF